MLKCFWVRVPVCPPLWLLGRVWFIATVLKTVDGETSRGSNPLAVAIYLIFYKDRNYYAITTEPVKTNAFLVIYKDGRTKYEEVATTSPLYDSYIKKMTD